MVFPPKHNSTVPSGLLELIGQLSFTGVYGFSFWILSQSHSAPFHTHRLPKKLSLLNQNSNIKKTPASSNEEVVTIWDPWLKCECRSYHRFCWFRGKKSLQTQVLARALQLAAVSEADQAVGSSEACVLLEGMESSQVASRYSLCDGRMWGCGPALPPLPSLGSAKN